MQQWEYLVVEHTPGACTFSCNQRELDTIAFSFRQMLTKQKISFRMENVSNLYLIIRDVNIAVPIFADYLGGRGWELVGVVALTSSVGYTFKHPID